MSKITRWEPENEQFWRETGSKIGWTTCSVTTFSLIFSFATWFVMSAVVVRLPNIGFKFTTMELFWLAAIPGLASGILRLIHSFFIPVFGTRPVVSIATIIKLLPMVWLGFAVQDLNTSWTTFMIIGFLSGMGGGDFSSYMPSTSIFFPKRLQGLSLGIQAGIGNFGVSVVQFVTPWIVGFSLIGGAYGAPQLFTKIDVIKDVAVTKDASGVVTDIVYKNPAFASAVLVTKNESGMVSDVVVQETAATKNMQVDIKRNDAGVVTDLTLKRVIKKDMWIQNAAFWYVPFLILAFILSVIFLKSIDPTALGIKGSPFKKMGEIFSSKYRARVHNWNCTITYVGSFGSFAGYAAAFPMMIKVIYGGFDGAPDPLKYAFFGPLIGGLSRAITGGFFDKIGGSKGMFWCFLGMIGGCLALIFGGYLTPTGLEKFPMFVWIMLWIFLMTGINNAATFRQYPIVFAYSPTQGAQIIGWTAAWAAFGPFIVTSLVGMSITKTGSAVTYFWGAIAYYLYCFIINWWYYTRKGAERYDWGSMGGTWWDKAKSTWQ
ncbi:MAG: NarK/NasA family nitrate transporter [Deltaproteobacteria bacterium]|nr:NarK/NasA family nitrate transporter [Deltaproteobacteria bacterium]MBZ0220566.1 MFS transporter [Deltaproteobacteria bacterium]